MKRPPLELTPEMDADLQNFLETYGEEPWFFDAYPTTDDAGCRLQVEVLDAYYVKDLLPRKLGSSYLVVVKVPCEEDIVVVEDEAFPKSAVGLA